MKLLTEYLERAIHFERLAAAETDPKLKEQLESKPTITENLQPRERRNLDCRRLVRRKAQAEIGPALTGVCFGDG
jgi:hypothetical protein